MKQFLIFSCLLACTIETQTMEGKKTASSIAPQNAQSKILKSLETLMLYQSNGISTAKESSPSPEKVIETDARWQDYANLYYDSPGYNVVYLKDSLHLHCDSKLLQNTNSLFCP